MSNPFGHEPGKPLECLSLAILLKKELSRDSSGELAYKVGFKIGGGIDQNPKKAPFLYPDTGIYVTQVEPGSPADRAGLRKHDKILQVNGIDYTMVTHEKAVKYIKKDLSLNMLVTRAEIA